MYTLRAWQFSTENEPSKILTPADDGLMYKTSKDSHKAAKAMQQQLNNISKWYHNTGSLISLDKAQTLTNRVAGELMPAVTFDGTVAERTIHLRYLGIHFNIMLTYRKHVETTPLWCKKGLSVLMAIAAKVLEPSHLFLLYQNVVLSVTDYGLGLTTMAQTNLLKLDRAQNESYWEPPRTQSLRPWGSY